MPARTGEQFLKGLRSTREVWVDGERVADVVDHPKLTGAAHALADVYDLHHKHAETCLLADPEMAPVAELGAALRGVNGAHGYLAPVLPALRRTCSPW